MSQSRSPVRQLSLLVVPVRWGGIVGTTRAEIEPAVRKAIAWYWQVSDGHLAFGPVTYAAPVTVEQESPHDNCFARGSRAARKAAEILTRRGVDPSTYGRVIYALPPLWTNDPLNPRCNFGGYADADGPDAVVLNGQGRANAFLLAHELGHTLGLSHSNVQLCPGCQPIEYGNPLSVMGGGSGLSGFERWYLGWLPALTPVANGTFLLPAFECEPSVLIVHTAQQNYAFENRESTKPLAGWDVPFPAGILVYENPLHGSGMSATIVDQHPGGDTGSFAGWPLGVGEQFTVPNTFQITYLGGTDPAQLEFTWLDATPPAQPRIVYREFNRLVLASLGAGGSGLHFLELSANGRTVRVRAHRQHGNGSQPAGIPIPIPNFPAGTRVRIVAVDYAGNRSPPVFITEGPRGYVTGPRLSTNQTTPANLEQVRVRYSTNPYGGTTVSLWRLVDRRWLKVAKRLEYAASIDMPLGALALPNHLPPGSYLVRVSSQNAATIDLHLVVQRR